MILIHVWRWNWMTWHFPCLGWGRTPSIGAKEIAEVIRLLKVAVLCTKAVAFLALTLCTLWYCPALVSESPNASKADFSAVTTANADAVVDSVVPAPAGSNKDFLSGVSGGCNSLVSVSVLVLVWVWVLVLVWVWVLVLVSCLRRLRFTCRCSFCSGEFPKSATKLASEDCGTPRPAFIYCDFTGQPIRENDDGWWNQIEVKCL